MKRLLIAYATTEGHTREIAEYLAAEALKVGYSTALFDVLAPAGEMDPSDFDGTIVAASVHMDCHPPAIEAFVIRHLKVLQTGRSAFLSVSLSAAGDAEDRYVAWEYVREFENRTGWRPPSVEIVAGALKFSDNDFFKRWAMRRLLAKKRIRQDPRTDYDYTAWHELSRFLQGFLTHPR